MNHETGRKTLFQPNFQKNLIAGLLTIIPLVVVWLVFDFFLETLSSFGRWPAGELARLVEARFPALSPVLADSRIQWLIAVIVALLALYAIGAITNRVIGQRVWALFERLIDRIPLVQTVYAAARKLVDVVRTKPESSQRVVLIDFPREGAKTIGLVMRTFADSTTGVEMAAVFVPTSPNPTTGYLQLVPLASLVPTDMSSEQAMAMVISAGAVGPETMSLSRRGDPDLGYNVGDKGSAQS